MMRHTPWLAGVAVALASSNLAVAQQGGNNGQQQDWRNMTPEQRQQAMQQMRSQRQQQMLVYMLNNAGITAQAPQEAIVAYSKAQDEATQPLQQLAQRLAEAVSTPGTSDEQIAAL